MSLNPMAAVVIAILLLLAVKNNREQDLINLLMDEKGFIKWIVVIGVLLWVYRNAPPDGRLILGGLFTLAVVGAVLESKNALTLLSDLIRGK